MEINHTVRKYLIDSARSNRQIVYYSDVVSKCDLKLNLDDKSDRNILSKILGTISAYELENKRPFKFNCNLQSNA